MVQARGLKNVDLILGILISCIFILLGRIGFLNPVFSVASGVFDNIQQGSYQIFSNVREDYIFLADLAGIEDRFRTLEKENEFYKVENERLQMEIDSMSIILEQQYFDLPYELTPVRVLTYTNDQVHVLINKGEAQNVVVGNALVVHNNLLGRVIKTYQNKSLVELITSSSILIPAVLPVDNLKGFVKGGEGGQVIISEIPNTKILTIGSVVVTSGADETLPYGLILGKLTGIISNQTDVAQQALVQPIIRLNQLSEAFVIINYGKAE
jgi:rod shape-determining protein MreC